MRSKVSFLLVISLLIFVIDLPANDWHGAELVVTKNDGQVLKGELIAVKQNSVLLLSPEGADVSVDTKDIRIIKIEKKSKVARWAVIGFLAGAGIGALYGVSMGEGEASPEATLLLAGVGGAGCLLIGALAGAAAGMDVEIKIEGKSDAEINKILEKLRRQARVSNAQ